ncbi:1,2-phenylacetyl-CoA epoxidase subunit PaaC [Aquimarina brevivitae]|uniref:Ring-1,2-phenylacetyl-CoA epoxidase subunit PaaC n=1 Tax=Aquimarina brevivitae TaxID=323412 RepID=A0A4Q7PH42_9FLAO|nr:1,2-phenylacetyl-CoA epoxidase subunit PaaC [Aquimarina brevivitae]RZS99873.1 ring-1,2-phenylacetyl-CoA epoxidase subunit PaaC [Aquimarina brevivitae]
MKNDNLIQYIYSIADNALILGQRLSELCGHGPSLETDIGITNMALDLLGQTRSYFQYAAKLSEEDITEDDLAYLRTERQYRNVLLVEQPNRDFAYVITRQFLFDAFHLLLLQKLQNSADETLSAIAKKSIKEVSYHFRFSSDWVKRLGDGTDKSHAKIQDAVDNLWTYTDELFHNLGTDSELIEKGIAIDLTKLKEEYYNKIKEIISEATLSIPESKYFQKGGKKGIHTEHMGYLLADLQYMQRTYPNMKW